MENSKLSAQPTFGGLLKQYRGEKNLTQQALADLSGLTQAEIARFEKGHQNPAWVTVHRIAKALGVTCEAFAAAAETEAAEARRPAQGTRKREAPAPKLKEKVKKTKKRGA
jgi:transcriptional regulator with XRE-family HTH domain